MSATRNRTAGHNWERECVRIFKDLGWEECISSRWESKRRDDSGVDLMYTDPYNVQCKTNSQSLNTHKILSEMPNEESRINIIMERRTEKRGNKFFKVGDYVHLKLEDFLSLIEKIKREQ